MVLTSFLEKLNKVDGNIYVIEESVDLKDGVYSGTLEHDNINPMTLTVHTGPKLTGDRIETYALSTPSLTPWKREIRIYADVPRVYISYECDGDTVEAEDINNVQAAIITTQKALNEEEHRAIVSENDLARVIQSETDRAIETEQQINEKVNEEKRRAENAEKVITDNLALESARAIKAEKKLTDDLSSEVARATRAEATLTENLSAEAARATEAEQKLTTDLLIEVTRSKAAENTLTDNLSAEVTRAKTSEKTLTDNLSAEISRATGAEAVLTDNLAAETTRATGAEKTLMSNLNAEITRAKAAEKANADNITTESNRATDKETELQGSIQTETTRAQAAEKTLTDHLSAEVTRSKEAEKALTDNLAVEVTRAKTAEKTNSDSISAEVTRARAKETELQGNITAEVSRATAAENDIRSTISTNKPNWDDKYTRNEVDNKFSALETAIDWKEAVATFADLATTYPQPDDGWTVNVKDTDYTYRWSGTAWIAISANAIPKATQSVDGLLSKEDKAALDDTNTKKHTHSNKSTLDKLTETLLTNWTDAYNKRHEHGNKTVIDKITQTLLDNWTAAHTHISDSVKHITATERTNWNDADSKKHTHTNKAVVDKITQIFLDNWSAAYAHISDAVKHITADERTTWNTVSNKVDKVSGKQLSTNDYTAAEKNKLSGIAPGAEVNVQSDWNVIDENSDAYIKNKPTSMPASDVLAWAKAANKPAYSWSEITSKPSTFAPSAHTHAKSQITDFPSSMPASDVAAWAKAAAKPSYGWTEITGKPSTFAPSSHNHTKNQITDMPTKVSQFTNDAGYITQADVDTSQSHTHSNKTILDKITQAMLDKWNSALTALPVHTHTKSQITDFPASLPANGGTANYANYLNVNNIVADTDLNTITTPGYYYCPMSSIVTTFKNSPTTMAFFMEVGKHAGVYQRIVEYTVSNPKTYERNYYSDSWGTWKNITVLTPVPAGAKFTDTVYVHPATAGNKHIPSGGASGQFLKWSADGTAVWAADNNTTYSAFKAATASAAGGAGLVPAPAAGAQAKYLRADGTWQTPPNTTYSDMKGATASTAGTHGLVPAPEAGAQTKYLRADGSWQTPPDTKYTHPNSGVVAGTYQNVTVNAQGHVTGGTPQGPFTWNQVHGAYTWDQMKGV
ncbi:MAG: hypothetical protein LUG90_14020 [Clostridiaceae bacterium]|nr:hypothetical protein [Clostridiaceae bacterium]